MYIVDCPGLNPRVRQSGLDDKHAISVEMSSCILETPYLLIFREQIENRVEHEIHQGVCVAHSDGRNVADLNSQMFAAGSASELIDHCRRHVDSID
jgi:hypothetical protein